MHDFDEYGHGRVQIYPYLYIALLHMSDSSNLCVIICVDSSQKRFLVHFTDKMILIKACQI